MIWLIPIIAGWFGTLWWPGRNIDAPPPGPHPEPWWTRLAIGIFGGLAAAVVLRMNPAYSDPMPGIVVAIATGCVAGAIVNSFTGAFRAKG